jgi:HD-GYP domain-containing protein (c-di-GMP phosphodiesterase class II)
MKPRTGKKTNKNKDLGKVLQLPQAIFNAGMDQRVLIECMRAIISTLEQKDIYTHGHSVRVAEYAVLLGTALNLAESEIQQLELASLFHDIGKIGIPDTILTKPARLSKAEFEIMKSHPARSVHVLEKISAISHLIPGIKYHHERFDGLGYPEGLQGEDIPLHARIILIADTYDAMTSTRPYRLALDKEIAFEELSRCAGTQFDPHLVKVFIQTMRARSHSKQAARIMTKKIA